MRSALLFLAICLLCGCARTKTGNHSDPRSSPLPSPPTEAQPQPEPRPRDPATDFPVYTPRTEIRGPYAESDFPIVDTPDYKGAIVPAEEAARHRYLANHYKD